MGAAMGEGLLSSPASGTPSWPSPQLAGLAIPTSLLSLSELGPRWAGEGADVQRE